MGLDLSRATIANWIIYSSDHWLRPIVDRMHEIMLKEKYLHSDETTVQVLNEPGKSATSKSYMWVYATIKDSRCPVRIFEYRPDRKGENPRKFLKGFNGTIIADAYAGYNDIEGCTNAYCWAHARRKFRDALPSDTEEMERTLPKQAMNKIGKLFAIEKEIELKTPEEKAKIRQRKAGPLLDDFFSWCKEKQYLVSSKKLSVAFTYVLNHEKGLREYVNAGHIPMTNSLDKSVCDWKKELAFLNKCRRSRIKCLCIQYHRNSQSQWNRSIQIPGQ